MASCDSKKDSIQAIVDYVLEVKPYHTKILEVDAEYVAEDPVRTTIVEMLHIEDDLGTVYVDV